MSEYRVIITETLKRAVTVEAESREEAEEAVRHQYQNSEHILVAEDFDGVSFSAQYPEQQVELPYGKMKELFRKAERAGTHVCGYITFMQDSFTAQYSERSRTYAVSSDNKAEHGRILRLWKLSGRNGSLCPAGAVYGGRTRW